MKTGPASSRFGMTVLLLCAALAVLASFWVLEVMRRSGEEAAPARKRVEPDYFVENFTFLRQSQVTGARYSLSGKRLEHDPVDGSHHIILPVVNSYSEQRPPQRGTAKRAVVSADNTRVQLYDSVTLDLEGSNGSPPSQLRTEYLLILTNEDLIRTDKPVVITQGNSTLNGIGMVANNATRQMQLLSAVHSTFAPAQRR